MTEMTVSQLWLVFSVNSTQRFSHGGWEYSHQRRWTSSFIPTRSVGHIGKNTGC